MNRQPDKTQTRTRTRTRRVLLSVALGSLLVLVLAIIWAVPRLNQERTRLLDDDQFVSEIRYVAIGDSLTVGVGADGEGGFVPRLEGVLQGSMLSERSVIVANHGRPGLAVDSLTRLIDTSSEVRQDLSRADVVTVTIGGNDLLALAAEVLGRGSECQVDLTECLSDDLIGLDQRWATMVSSLRDEMPEEAQLLISTVYLPGSELTSFGSELEEMAIEVVDEFNAMIVRQSEGQYLVADVRQRFAEVQADEPRLNLFSEDGIHPSRAGYEVIGEVFAELVEE